MRHQEPPLDPDVRLELLADILARKMLGVLAKQVQLPTPREPRLPLWSSRPLIETPPRRGQRTRDCPSKSHRRATTR